MSVGLSALTQRRYQLDNIMTVAAKKVTHTLVTHDSRLYVIDSVAQKEG